MTSRWAIGGALGTAVLALLLALASAAAAPPTGPRLAVAKVNWNPWRTTLLTVAPDGSRPVRLAGGQEDGPLDSVLIGPLAWRPDGGELAFSAIREILLIRADGSAVRRLNVADAGAPVYAADGLTLAFSREDEGTAAIWTIDLESGVQRRLTSPRRGVEYVPSSFSPDGLTLLATRIDRRADTVEAVALQLDSGEVTRLLTDGREPVYSPDGSRIALFREVGKRRNDDLFVLDVAAKKLRRLTRTPHKNELFASWDPSGQRIAFSRFRGWRLEWANSIVEIRRRNLREGGSRPEANGLLGRGVAAGPRARGRPDRLLGRRHRLWQEAPARIRPIRVGRAVSRGHVNMHSTDRGKRLGRSEPRPRVENAGRLANNDEGTPPLLGFDSRRTAPRHSALTGGCTAGEGSFEIPSSLQRCCLTGATCGVGPTRLRSATAAVEGPERPSDPSAAWRHRRDAVRAVSAAVASVHRRRK